MKNIILEEIKQLKSKIVDYQENKIPEDKFKHFRLTRGVYGQRQAGAQMVRIKLRFGKISANQLEVIARLSEQYASGNLHLTTRQNIQLHYVRLPDTPKIWEELSKVDVTLRESCGNTVRGITASPTAGVASDEPFDVSPYADQVYRFFLRNPICQDMGRKFKIAFSSGPADTAFSFIHDLGFVPVLQKLGSTVRKGFKVYLGGGLGAQAFEGFKVHEFLPVEDLLPFSEAVVRAFDLYGERKNRNKARLKFLLKNMGVDEFLHQVSELKMAVKSGSVKYEDDVEEILYPEIKVPGVGVVYSPSDSSFNNWLKTNTFQQKQAGYYGVYVRIGNGNLNHNTAISLANVIRIYSQEEARLTLNQGLLIRFVPGEQLEALYRSLKSIGLGKPGQGSLHDVTTCPGTDTCNLAVTNSTGLGREIEKLMEEKYPDLINEQDIHIKISGCMNSCGQHMVADIGFHGSSIKVGERIAPAMQVVLGGGISSEGKGRIAEKVIKVPTKRAPVLVDEILKDYLKNKSLGENFFSYYQRKGKLHFYDLVKYLGDKDSFLPEEFSDWGKVEEKFVPEIGTGECAGVIIDSVESMLIEAEEKYTLAEKALSEQLWADGIFHYYTAFIIGAKAMLLTLEIESNSRIEIARTFQEKAGDIKDFKLRFSFEEEVSKMQTRKPDEIFAKECAKLASEFCGQVTAFRSRYRAVKDNVIVSRYKA